MKNNQELPLVSIIIPTYQHADAVVACLNTIFVQSYSRIEVIVVDDGSTDGTKERLKPFLDKIEYIYQNNAGSNPARNAGWRRASGDFLLFVDADVVLNQDAIEKMVQAMLDHHEVSIVYSGFYFGRKRFAGFPFSVQRLREMNYIHTTSLIRAIDFPGFDESIKRLQDWDVWLTMVLQGKKAFYLPEILFSITIHGTSRIGSSWLPSFLYRFPWSILGWKPRQLRKYFEARDILFNKHGL